MKTIIRSARQDAIEPHKPVFRFYFVDEPQYATYDFRGKTASLLKSYRKHPERYILRKAGVHLYYVQTVNSNAIACIEGN